MSSRFTTDQFIEAIADSGGIVSTIAKRVGCSWGWARKFIDEHPTVLAAYNDENERVLDLAESILIKSIQSGDSQDAKWLLSRKGKSRGYVERTETDLTTGGKPLAWRNFMESDDTDPGASSE